MKQETISSPIFLKYLNLYEKNPRSRVFAPLAESYRQMGMREKALEVLKEGIKYHPDYVMGYLELAFCYHDMGKDALSYATLRPLVNRNRDNLRLQKLFAQVCLAIGHIEEALETFKYLLFINPKDQEASEEVKRLERMLGEKATLFKSRESKEGASENTESVFNLDELSPIDDKIADEWEELDLAKYETKAEEKSVDQTEEILPVSEENKVDEEAPVITHTLVDLYVQQGHLAKAVLVLEKILELNPHDQRSIEKLVELKKMAASNIDEGHNKLMKLIDVKVKREKPASTSSIERKFILFQEALKKKAEDKLQQSK